MVNIKCFIGGKLIIRWLQELINSKLSLWIDNNLRSSWYSFQIFLRMPKFFFFLLYIKINTVLFRNSKYSCIRINKNIFGNNSLFFYQNQKFRPQISPCIYFNFFEGVKVKFCCFISKQIPYYFVSLKILLLKNQ